MAPKSWYVKMSKTFQMELNKKNCTKRLITQHTQNYKWKTKLIEFTQKSTKKYNIDKIKS